MRQGELKRRLEEVARDFTLYHEGVREVFPLAVQHLVEWSSHGTLVVATIDRYGNEFRPAAEHWNGMHHSFYRVKYKENDQVYHPVGDLVIPQPAIGSASSIAACVHKLLLEYPVEGAVVRWQKTYTLPTGNGHDLSQSFFSSLVIPMNGGFAGRSILNGGNPVCDCYRKSCLSHGVGELCKKETIHPYSEMFIS